MSAGSAASPNTWSYRPKRSRTPAQKSAQAAAMPSVSIRSPRGSALSASTTIRSYPFTNPTAHIVLSDPVPPKSSPTQIFE